jgi:hypothetical protein
MQKTTLTCYVKKKHLHSLGFYSNVEASEGLLSLVNTSFNLASLYWHHRTCMVVPPLWPWHHMCEHVANYLLNDLLYGGTGVRHCGEECQ